MDTIKLKRATKSVANASTKVLEKDEVLVVTPDSGSGKGKCQLKLANKCQAIFEKNWIVKKGNFNKHHSR